MSCQKDHKEVLVQGQLIDQSTKKPISDTPLVIENWAYGNSPDESYTIFQEYLTKTNSEGYFEQYLDVSSYVVLRIKSIKYRDTVHGFNVSNGKNTFNLKLEPLRDWTDQPPPSES